MFRFVPAEALGALRQGKRWWPAEIALRGLGLLLLAACARLSLLVHRLALVPRMHPADALDLALCTAAVVLLCSGLTLTFVGPGLFRRVPLPPHFTRRTEHMQ